MGRKTIPLNKKKVVIPISLDPDQAEWVKEKQASSQGSLGVRDSVNLNPEYLEWLIKKAAKKFSTETKNN